MKDFQGYLKPNVVVEPLISQWYAWSYLIPPATAARYLTESQLKVMQSFVDAPEVHVSALRDPAMQGGPFINHSAERADEIEALIAKMQAEQSRLMALSSAIATLTDRLAEHPPGQSLEPLYAQLPEALKGYVELVYDDNHSPAIRFIEGLLYHSEYYDTRRQSIALRVYEDIDQRSFVMSTPRLPDENSLFLSIPFNDARLDALFRMRHTPASVPDMAERLEIPESRREFFFSLFTPNAASPPPPYQEDGVRIRYLGHACVLIETADVSILCDPLVSNEHPTGMARYSYADLPETIDYAVITHNHQDHVMLETLLQLRHKIGQVVIPTGQKGSLLDPSLKLALQQIGFANVRALEEMESIPLPGGELVSIPVLGEHGDLNIATKNAYWVNLKGRSILCAADSNNLDPDLYKNIRHLLGELDVLFIGMECDGAPFTWAYGPILSQSVSRQQAQPRRLDGSNADRGAALVNQLNPQQVYVYAMGQEPWLLYITSISYTPESDPIQQSNRLVAMCQQQGRISERVLGQKEIELQPKAMTEKGDRVIPVSESLSTADPKTKVHARSRIAIPAPQITAVAPEKNSQLTQLLEHLQSRDVRLRADNDTLHCNAPKGVLTADLIAQLEEHKSAIVALIKGRPADPDADDTATAPSPPQPIDKQADELTQLLDHLQSRDVRLWLDGNTLRCNAPKGALTSELTAQLKERKPEIIALIKGTAVQTAPPLPHSPAAAADWQQDILLPADITPYGRTAVRPNQLTTSSRTILLTGATGFLGAFLLEALLHQTTTQIVCLVRAESAAAAWQRLQTSLAGYGIWQEDFQSRLTIQPGDLAQPRLGLSDPDWRSLAASIDAIYHNGAGVHHVSPYALLRETNVWGTREVIRLACQHHPKPLHFTSTLSVLPPTPPAGQTKMHEAEPLDRYPVPAGGYNRTKWVAEQLVQQAGDRGLPITIYRPGPISGHSQTGAFNANDFLYRLMQGYIQLGSAPQGAMPLDILPVDYVSSAIAYLSQQPQSQGRVFHLIHPQPASSDGLFAACRAAGYSIQRVPYEQWHGQLRAIAQGQTDHPLYPLVALFSSRSESDATETTAQKELPFDCRNAITGLADAPFDCPPLDEALFTTYLSALKKSGALKPPPVSASH
ncbi:MAG: thioester reductase domain-containing protein [Leptolyngbyaceae cyanobacterium]